jgi:3-phosphoshikimate 1-carboxyvinyltransferase
LRVKESDRLTATTRELSKMGAKVEELKDGLRITGGKSLKGANGRSHGDHRIAMTLGVAGLLATGKTTISNPDTASISYPSFWDDLDSLRSGTTA